MSHLTIGQQSTASQWVASLNGQAMDVDVRPATENQLGPSAATGNRRDHVEADARDGSHYSVPPGGRSAQRALWTAGRVIPGTGLITRDEIRRNLRDTESHGTRLGWPNLLRAIATLRPGFGGALDAVVSTVASHRFPIEGRFSNHAEFCSSACDALVEAARNASDAHTREVIHDRLKLLTEARHPMWFIKAMPAFEYLIMQSAGSETETYIQGYLNFGRAARPYGEAVVWSRLTNILGVHREPNARYTSVFADHPIPDIIPAAVKLVIAQAMVAAVQNFAPDGHFIGFDAAVELAHLARMDATIKSGDEVIWSARSRQVEAAFVKSRHPVVMGRSYSTMFPPELAFDVIWAFPNNAQAKHDAALWARHDLKYTPVLMNYIFYIAPLVGKTPAQVLAEFVAIEFQDRGITQRTIEVGYRPLSRDPSVILEKLEALQKQGDTLAGQLLTSYQALPVVNV